MLGLLSHVVAPLVHTDSLHVIAQPAPPKRWHQLSQHILKD